jgi:hypothetical protein
MELMRASSRAGRRTNANTLAGRHAPEAFLCRRRMALDEQT